MISCHLSILLNTTTTANGNPILLTRQPVSWQHTHQRRLLHFLHYLLFIGQMSITGAQG